MCEAANALAFQRLGVLTGWVVWVWIVDKVARRMDRSAMQRASARVGHLDLLEARVCSVPHWPPKVGQSKKSPCICDSGENSHSVAWISAEAWGFSTIIWLVLDVVQPIRRTWSRGLTCCLISMQLASITRHQMRRRRSLILVK
jgi:hypothetical protein